MAENVSPGNRTVKREIAYKVRIKDVLDGKYIKEEGWTPNYILTSDGRRVSRVNIIAVVVSKNTDNLNYALVLDDGSGRISIRSFDSGKILDDFDIGDIILIIGRPREYGNEKYLVSEIIRKVENKKWVDVRKIELKKEPEIGKKEEIKEEVEEEVIETDGRSLPQKIFSLVKELDKGDGVEVEKIIEKLNSEDVDKMINNLLKEGEMFEIRPGRIKILE